MTFKVKSCGICVRFSKHLGGIISNKGLTSDKLFNIIGKTINWHLAVLSAKLVLFQPLSSSTEVDGRPPPPPHIYTIKSANYIKVKIYKQASKLWLVEGIVSDQ